MRRFFVVLYTVAVLLHVPLIALWGSLLRAPLGGYSWLLATLISVVLAGMFHGRMQLARWDRPLSKARAIVEEAYYVHWCALLPWLPLALVMWLALWLSGVASTGELSRAELALALAYPIALALAFWGVVIRRRWVRVRHIVVPIARLAPAFAGYRLAQLSDLHLGSLCPRERVDRWVQKTNSLDVDLVALTGDYVTSGVRFHQDIADALGKLRAKDGVFAVMGNHDYYGDGQPLMDLLRAAGIRLLRNERCSLERHGQRLAIAGVDDIYTERIDVAAPFKGHPAGEPMLMLAHDPRSFRALARRGASLVLSGHTHWGQVGLPFAPERFNYARVLTEYHAGLSRHRDAQLYVNPGLGTTGPPLRFGTWPEITVIELQPAAQA